MLSMSDLRIGQYLSFNGDRVKLTGIESSALTIEFPSGRSTTVSFRSTFDRAQFDLV